MLQDRALGMAGMASMSDAPEKLVMHEYHPGSVHFAAFPTI